MIRGCQVRSPLRMPPPTSVLPVQSEGIFTQGSGSAFSLESLLPDFFDSVLDISSGQHRLLECLAGKSERSLETILRAKHGKDAILGFDRLPPRLRGKPLV